MYKEQYSIIIHYRYYHIPLEEYGPIQVQRL